MALSKGILEHSDNFSKSLSPSIFMHRSLKPQLAVLNKTRLFWSYIHTKTFACIPKAHSHSQSGGSIWASLECQCCFWIAGGSVVIQIFMHRSLKPQLAALNKTRLFCSYIHTKTFACIPKAHSHSHSMSGGSFWASLECQCCFWIAGGLVVLQLTVWLLTIQLFKNSIDTHGKLRMINEPPLFECDCERAFRIQAIIN